MCVWRERGEGADAREREKGQEIGGEHVEGREDGERRKEKKEGED